MTHKMQFTAEVGKVLQMMIHSVYKNEDIFLRELISNSSDACEKLRYMLLNEGRAADNLEINIWTDPKNKELIIEDNGIGMSQEELISNLGSIATSGTQKFIEQIQSVKDANMIGQFGVGFYSSFMVAESVSVYSSQGEKTYVWSSDGQEGFSVEESDIVLARGTRVVLKLKESKAEFLERYRVQHLIQTYSDHISFPINFIENGEKTRLNKEDAIWIKNPNSVSEAEYESFYSHIYYMPGKPFAIIHNNIEGNVSYRSLLFIPNNKPYDLLHPQAKSRVKLFINRVFITDEESGLLPSYLRFVKGVVDSADLPLNVSRETLQHNNIVNRIKKSLVSKILSSLEKKRIENFESFSVFWSNFGEVIKEGLCQGALDEKERLLDLCIFHSMNSQDKMITLDEYIKNIKDGQNEIYYITGNSNLNSLRNLPHLDGFKKRGVDVLLLNDNVDDFWVNVISNYKNYALRSVTSSSIDLDHIEKFNDDSEAIHVNNEDKDILISCLKNILDGKVKDVQISTKLIDSPACLSIQEGHMSSRMENVLLEQKQLPNRSLKILEINPNHQLIKNLLRFYKNGENDKVECMASLIFGQACLLENEPIGDIVEFVRNINKVAIFHE
ncbi:Chaperone protein HtpG [Candidatus Cyrtobacter comes]|uniref:Chaperone protein HtpG n=1 Tax=Candidatus Cyrtobacter comes TaxID=675776 RepID=A0ABU5L885_9RICK|nr:molecular chaperone HtpG [Candidatus Cyrtobacter comes]MDZ5762329.1 Chaperone protein HtpG [Candidatus Cyrtobacter comes]